MRSTWYRTAPRRTSISVCSPIRIPSVSSRSWGNLMEQMNQEDPDLHVEIETIGTQKVPEHFWKLLNEDDPLIAAIFEIAPSYTGRKPEWRMSAGGGRPDIWNLGSKWVSFGVARGGNAHAPDEWVDIDSLANPGPSLRPSWPSRSFSKGARDRLQPALSNGPTTPARHPHRDKLDDHLGFSNAETEPPWRCDGDGGRGAGHPSLPEHHLERVRFTTITPKWCGTTSCAR